MKYGPLAKQVLKVRRRSRGMLPREIFKIKIVRIALVAICASKYNYDVMELARHCAQEPRYNNKMSLHDFFIHFSNLRNYWGSF